MESTDLPDDGIDSSENVHDFPQQSANVVEAVAELINIDTISPEDEATINQILGDTSIGGIFGSPEPSREQVEAMAKLRMDAMNYNIQSGAERAADALVCLAEQFNQSYEVLMQHLTLEWNNAIIRQDMEDNGTPADDLQALNPVRFTEYGRNHIDQGIALLRESLKR